MADSEHTSTTNFGLEGADPTILEKIESQRAPGEYSPPRSFTDEKLDDSSLEKGSLPSDKGTTEGQGKITHRPTGWKVPNHTCRYLIE